MLSTSKRARMEKQESNNNKINLSPSPSSSSSASSSPVVADSKHVTLCLLVPHADATMDRIFIQVKPSTFTEIKQSLWESATMLMEKIASCEDKEMAERSDADEWPGGDRDADIKEWFKKHSIDCYFDVEMGAQMWFDIPVDRVWILPSGELII